MEMQQASLIAGVVLVLYMLLNKKGSLCGESFSNNLQSAQARSFGTGHAVGNVVPFHVNTNEVGRGVFGVPLRTLRSTSPSVTLYGKDDPILSV